MAAMLDQATFIEWAAPEEVNIAGEDFGNVWKHRFVNWIPDVPSRASYALSGEVIDSPFTVWENESLEWIHNAFDLVSDPWPEY